MISIRSESRTIRRDEAKRAGSDLHVALMGRSLRGRFNGVARYTDGLARALAPHLGVNLRVFVTHADDGLEDANVTRIPASFRTPNEYTRAFWEQCIVPFSVRRMKPAVYHSPNYILPLAVSCPTVVTVHDTAFLDRRVHRMRSHLYLTALTTLALRKADAVICVSDYTRRSLITRYPRVAPKTCVIGEGIDTRFGPQPVESAMAFRQRYGAHRPYVLFTGTIEPRKNIARLIRAFDSAVETAQLPHELLIVGGAGWKAGDVQSSLERARFRNRIRLLGYVQDHDLPGAYAGADLFVYPSLDEGFGLPPLEAMACGTPVVTSNTSALAEIAGPAALTIDPRDEAALTTAIIRGVTEQPLREQLAASGRRRAALYRWDAVADQIIDLYETVAR